MAVLKEGETIIGEANTLRVAPDLKVKLPNLFGDSALENTLREALVTNPDVGFTLTNSDWPIDYIGVMGVTHKRLDPIELTLRRAANQQGWLSHAEGTVDQAWKLTLSWLGRENQHQSRVMEIGMGRQPLMVYPLDKKLGFGLWRLTYDDLATSNNRKQKFLTEFNQIQAVQIGDLTIDEAGRMSAVLTHKKLNLKPFILRLPTILDVRFTNGIQTERSLKRWQTQFV